MKRGRVRYEAKRYNQEFKETIVELYRAGDPVNQLTNEYGNAFYNAGETIITFKEITKDKLQRL